MCTKCTKLDINLDVFAHCNRIVIIMYILGVKLHKIHAFIHLLNLLLLISLHNCFVHIIQKYQDKIAILLLCCDYAQNNYVMILTIKDLINE